jgi:hypothetical protein
VVVGVAVLAVAGIALLVYSCARTSKHFSLLESRRNMPRIPILYRIL